MTGQIVRIELTGAQERVTREALESARRRMPVGGREAAVAARALDALARGRWENQQGGRSGMHGTRGSQNSD